MKPFGLEFLEDQTTVASTARYVAGGTHIIVSTRSSPDPDDTEDTQTTVFNDN